MTGPYALTIYLLANAWNPNIPPEVVWYETAEECAKARSLILRSGLSRRVTCVSWQHRIFNIAR